MFFQSTLKHRFDESKASFYFSSNGIHLFFFRCRVVSICSFFVFMLMIPTIINLNSASELYLDHLNICIAFLSEEEIFFFFFCSDIFLVFQILFIFFFLINNAKKVQAS